MSDLPATIKEMTLDKQTINTTEINCSHDKPISDCIVHWQDFCFVTGYTIEQRVIKFLLGKHVGISSEAICSFMLGINKTLNHRYPMDQSDRARCIKLLKLVPEWIERLDELKAMDAGTISINGGEPQPKAQTKYSWTYQIPLIIIEGGF